MRCYFLKDSSDPKDISDIEILKKGLKQTFSVRGMMGGELYFSILNDQANSIYDRLIQLGISSKEIYDFIKEQ